MDTDNRRWVRISDSVEELSFFPNHIGEVLADGRLICLAKKDGRLFAFAHKCPHAGGLLTEGWLDPLGNIVCPLHRYKFCLANGRNVSGEGYYLKHWPVEVREDGVFVGFEKNKLFGLF
jgi:nitrite reductase/ring-hydroxylating ferredoxin subunit